MDKDDFTLLTTITNNEAVMAMISRLVPNRPENRLTLIHNGALSLQTLKEALEEDGHTVVIVYNVETETLDNERVFISSEGSTKIHLKK